MQSSIREIATGGKSREARSQMKRLLQNLKKHAGCGGGLLVLGGDGCITLGQGEQS